MKWTIKEMLCGMLMTGFIAGAYWNQVHGHKQFNRWMAAILGTAAVVIALCQFARHRRVAYLIGGGACACIAVFFWVLIAVGQFK